jgi:hypothetical protein
VERDYITRSADATLRSRRAVKCSIGPCWEDRALLWKITMAPGSFGDLTVCSWHEHANQDNDQTIDLRFGSSLTQFSTSGHLERSFRKPLTLKREFGSGLVDVLQIVFCQLDLHGSEILFETT